MEKPWCAHLLITPERTNEYSTVFETNDFSLKQRTMIKGEIIHIEKHDDKIQLVKVELGKLKVSRSKQRDGLKEVKEVYQGDYFYIERHLFHEIVCTESAVMTSTYIYVK